MKTPLTPPPLAIVSFILALGYILISHTEQKWYIEPLSSLCYIVVVLDVFLWYAQHSLFKTIGAHLSEVTSIIGLSGITSTNEPLALRCISQQIQHIRNGLESLKHGAGFLISNPFIARDISFHIISSIRPHDTITATMNVAERPFLLADTYRNFFLKNLHEPVLKPRRTNIQFTRIIISNLDQRNTPQYQDLVAKFRALGITVYESTPLQFSQHGLPGDIILRIRGSSDKDLLCLVGDKDPHSPADEYRALLVFGDNVQEYRNKCSALISELQ